MADLVGNRMADAMEKIAPKAKLGWEGFRKTQTQMIDQCGRPLDSKIQNNGKAFLGEDVLPEKARRLIGLFSTAARRRASLLSTGSQSKWLRVDTINSRLHATQTIKAWQRSPSDKDFTPWSIRSTQKFNECNRLP